MFLAHHVRLRSVLFVWMLLTLMMVAFCGVSIAQENIASQADGVTVETLFSVSPDPAQRGRQVFWLAGIIAMDSNPAESYEGIALVWHEVTTGFFPSWTLALVPFTTDDMPVSGDISSLTNTPGYQALKIATPEKDLTYRASLSVDFTQGVVAIRVDDMARGQVIVSGRQEWPWSTHSPELIAFSGPYTGSGLCEPCDQGDHDGHHIVTVDTSVHNFFVPVDASWHLLTQSPTGFERVITAYLSQNKPAFTTITSPDGSLAGELRLLLRHENGDQTWVSQEPSASPVPLPLKEFAAGNATFELRYVIEQGENDPTFVSQPILSRSYTLIPAELTMRFLSDRAVGEEFAGRMEIVADGGPIEAEITVRSEWSVSESASRPSASTTPTRSDESTALMRLEETVLSSIPVTLSEEPVFIPVQLPIDVPRTTLVDINFSVDISPGHFRTSITPRTVKFLAIGSQFHQPVEANTTMMQDETVPRARNYDFQGSISEEVLNNYLSRAVTMLGMADPRNPELMEDVRFILNTGAKFIGRAAYLWGVPHSDDELFESAAHAAALVHEADPEIMMQAAIFEAIYKDGVNQVKIPAWVFEEFDLPVENRHFNYDAMLFPDGLYVNHWSTDPPASVPDMTQLETRMWFFYRAKRYIDAGYEALHMGQVHLMGAADDEWVHWQDLLDRVRAYAAENARRNFVLIDTHTHGIVVDGDRLLFDFHSYPLRITEIPGQPLQGQLIEGRIDSIYGRSLSGITPSGWFAESTPYLVEVDNWGPAETPGVATNNWWVWGYDEISWFARQDEAYRNEWLRYAWDWVKNLGENGWLQMPGRRVIADPVDGIWTYRAHTRSVAMPQGFNQEETIKDIWARE